MRSHTRPILVLALSIALIGCGSSDAGSTGSAGIRGRAIVGPRCPVELEGSPCPDTPWEGIVVATDTATKNTFTVRTDAEGRFRLPLAPGTYELAIRTDTSPPRVRPQTVTVPPGSFVDVILSVDSGIR